MVFEFINQGLDYLLSPLLGLPSIVAVIIVSLAVSLIITFVYKLVTNQSLMKDLKTEIKELQKEMKGLKDNPGEAMKAQKKAMETNMKYMGHSMRPTLITFIPIILIFGWMNSHFAYEPISPGESFEISAMFDKSAQGQVSLIVPEEMTVDGEKVKDVQEKVSWIMKGEKEGKYFVDLDYGGEKHEKEVLITNGKLYSKKNVPVKNSQLKEINIDYEKKIVLNLLGWKMGWLATYIITSLISTMSLRKIMKIY
tara:strand:- start:5265 stop:6023 length:759 start_codon:yes stop_codon:yes gene_type:complete